MEERVVPTFSQNFSLLGKAGREERDLRFELLGHGNSVGKIADCRFPIAELEEAREK
jgi:hypothetical protein